LSTLVREEFTPKCPPKCWTGWWFFATPLKNDGVKVSWDDDIQFPTEWKVIKAMFQITNQWIQLLG